MTISQARLGKALAVSNCMLGEARLATDVDGVLAIFRVEEDEPLACANAYAAALAGLEAVGERTALPVFTVGYGLHLGEVAYGNVGSGMRLDYTVIGRDVNFASRIATLVRMAGPPY
jgi:adenylate cyclase